MLIVTRSKSCIKEWWGWCSGQRKDPLLKWSWFRSCCEVNETGHSCRIIKYKKAILTLLLAHWKYLYSYSSLFFRNFIKLNFTVWLDFYGTPAPKRASPFWYRARTTRIMIPPMEECFPLTKQRQIVRKQFVLNIYKAWWRPECCWLGWGSMSIGDPSKSQ